MKNLLSCNCNKPKIVIEDNEENLINAINNSSVENPVDKLVRDKR